MLRIVAALAVLWLLLIPHASAQISGRDVLHIAGGGLPAETTVARADADNFERRLNKLPRLEDPPDAHGVSYRVTTNYWRAAVPLEKDEDDEGLETSDTAEYFPDGGFVRAEVGEDDAWVVLNLRQRAILDRYISLAKAGAIGTSPSTLDVLSAAADAGEVFGVAAGNKPVDPELATTLFMRLAAANPAPALETPEPPDPGDGGFWLIVTLLEGRDLRYYYDGQTLTESLGTERYDAASVADLMQQIAPASIPAIKQEKPAGSRLWWPVMVLGGLSAIAAAVWLRRRTRIAP